MRTPFVTALAVLILIDALGWALGVLATLRYVITHRSLPTVGGIRLLSGPFETLGYETIVNAKCITSTVVRRMCFGDRLHTQISSATAEQNHDIHR